MKKYITPLFSALVVIAYLMALRFIADPLEPYFILGPAVAGLVAWLSGRVAGLMVATLLIPATNFIYGQFDMSTGFSVQILSLSYITLMLLAAVGIGTARNYARALRRKLIKFETSNDNLVKRLAGFQDPGGLQHMCSECSSIKNEAGRWVPISDFLRKNTKMEFSHSICPQCVTKSTYGEIEFNPDRN